MRGPATCAWVNEVPPSQGREMGQIMPKVGEKRCVGDRRVIIERVPPVSRRRAGAQRCSLIEPRGLSLARQNLGEQTLLALGMAIQRHDRPPPRPPIYSLVNYVYALRVGPTRTNRASTRGGT
jgi:hypothetical protein